MQTEKISLPQEIIQYYEKCIDQANSEILQDLSKNIKSLHYGYRLGNTPIDFLRRRIKIEIKKSKIPKEIEVILRETSLYQEFFVVLSYKAIANCFNEFSNYFGWEAFLGSLILDERRSIRELALNLIDSESKIKQLKDQSKTKEASSKEINFIFSRFFNVTKSIYSPTSHAENHIKREKNIKPTILDEKNLSKLIEESVIVKRLRRDLKEKTETVRINESNYANIKSQLETLKTEKNNLVIELSDLIKSVDSTVNIKVKKLIDSRIYPWLINSEKIPDLTLITNLSVISKTERLLEEQKKVDLRHKKRSQIRNEIDRVDDLVKIVEEALLDSIKPIPELKNTLPSLKALSNELKGYLNSSSIASKSERVNDFAIYISNITKVDELKRIRETIENRMLHENWTNQEQNDVYETLNKKCLTLYSSETGLSNKFEESLYDQISPVYIIQNNILNSTNFKFIIDGHNVLFSLKHQIGHLYQEDIPKKEARDYLISKLKKLTDTYKNIDCDLWFDSSDESDISISNNLRVLFSGGTGTNRADNKIIQSLSVHNLSKNKRNLVVVSADNEIKTEVKNQFQISMHPLELMQVL
jgi:hypothetical protein